MDRSVSQEWTMRERTMRIRRSMRRAAGFTLVELLVAITIVVLLTGIVVMTGRSIHKGMANTQAKTQIALLADAINKYSAAWPAWKDAAGRPLAQRGWPHWSPTHLFPTSGLQPYSGEAGFNDPGGLLIVEPRVIGDDDSTNGRGDVEVIGETLAYQLTSAARGAPVLADPQGALVKSHDPTSGPTKLYPRLASETSAQPRRELVDPWGTIYRYAWLARDSQTPKGWRAITSSDTTRTANDASTGGPQFAVAEAVVLESAGPDGKFGNIWKRNASPTDIADAEDNESVKP